MKNLPEIEKPILVEKSPLPPLDMRTVFLGGIFFILFFTVLRYAAVIVIPVVLAFILKLVCQPLLRGLLKLKLPITVASFMIIVILMTGLAGLGTVISGPAASLVDKLPEALPKMQHRVGFIKESIEDAQKVMEQAEDITNRTGKRVMPVELRGSRLSDKVFSGTQAFASSLFSTMLILFFLLISSDTFLRKLVEILPRFQDKRQAVDISQQIERDISRYLLTITVMNGLVGIATFFIAWWFEMEEPLLWGAVAFVLNYIPILGPISCAALLFVANLMAGGTFVEALLPMGCYMLVHFIEGTLITPLLLAKRFTLNPFLVVLSLIFWYWMWGFCGAILAVPMLAIAKIICDRIERMKPIGHFLEG